MNGSDTTATKIKASSAMLALTVVLFPVVTSLLEAMTAKAWDNLQVTTQPALLNCLQVEVESVNPQKAMNSVSILKEVSGAIAVPTVMNSRMASAETLMSAPNLVSQ